MRPVILILGPTAGGKSRLAMDLATTLVLDPERRATSPPVAEIISCDSMQIYRSMDIGTAKPTIEEQRQVPHHLIDLVEPFDDTFSVDRWLKLAQEKIAEIRGRDRDAIIVGGTNLYVQAFLSGMTQEGPAPNLELRSKLTGMEAAALRTWLERIDPAAAERIHLNDRKRTIRAIEVFETTGKRLSELQTQWATATTAINNAESPIPYSNSVFILGLEYSVETINRRINARVKAMVEAGLVDEVRRLHEGKLLGRNAREALGYKQIIEHLEGRCTLVEAIEQIKIRTRRYAKQQRTWLRRFKLHPNSIWITADALTTDELAARAREAVQSKPTNIAGPPWQDDD